MTFVGKVSNGAIIIPAGVKLPEGANVRVEPLEEKPLASRLREVIGAADGLPPDFAENHDHYLRGTPKK